MTACVAFGLVRLPSPGGSPPVERLCWTASTSKPVTAAAPGSWSVGFQVTETEVLSTERPMLAAPGCGAPASPGAGVGGAGVPGAGGAAAHAGAAGLAVLGDGQALTVAVGVLALPRHRALAEIGLRRDEGVGGVLEHVRGGELVALERERRRVAALGRRRQRARHGADVTTT